MNKTTTFVLTFIGSGIALFLIFYFYDAQIFDVRLNHALWKEPSADQTDLKSFLGMRPEWEAELAENGVTIKRSLSGWMILFILTIGLPAMIAYRVAYAKRPNASAQENESQDSEEEG